jgi:transglutaminase-like putative cysteine protease
MPLKNCARKVWAENAPHFRWGAIWLAGWIVVMVLDCVAPQCRGQQSRPDIAPPSKWVVPIPFNPRTKLDDVDPSQEMRWVLKDRQINAQDNETFHHEVRQLLTPSGVNNFSHISVDYDPSYQSLKFHWVRIWRGTNSLNRLDPDKIEVTQSGLDPDELLFSAEKSALLLLEDVRMGDIIDFAYSIQGDNPVFAGRFQGVVEAQSSAPIERMTTRLLWPAARRLYVQNHGTDVKYTAARKGDVVEFTWNFKQVPGWRDEPPLPVWYHPLPWVQLSEFQKWSEVNQLALELFTNATPLSPELKQAINEWKHLPGKEERVLAALRFVQDDVRYLGIESGASGYKPAAPATVFDRRFGDCKDKSFLLVTILRALGMEAWPTFVNTRWRQTVADLHPAVTIFDHVITQVKLDEATYWLDATANYQRGPLAVRSWPDYGCGLVVRPGATGLTPIAPSPVLPRTTVTEYIQLGKLDEASSLKVVTIAEGRDAERLRAEYATTVRDDIERGNLNYYAKCYPDITQSAPLVYTDDEQQNKIEVDEFYNVQRIWKRQPDETFFHCWIYPVNIDKSMRAPAVSLRTMPLGVAYPVHQFFHADITVPTLAIVRPDERTIENPGFYFHRLVTIGSGRLFVDYEYRSLTDAVQPEAVPNYVRQLGAAEELLDYSIPSD